MVPLESPTLHRRVKTLTLTLTLILTLTLALTLTLTLTLSRRVKITWRTLSAEEAAAGAA